VCFEITKQESKTLMLLTVNR